MNELPTRADLIALLREGWQATEYIRSVIRHYDTVAGRTPQQWVLTEYPPGYTIDANNIVRDPDGNVVKNATEDVNVWAYIRSAFVAWRMVAAVLENEESFRDQSNQAVLKSHHRYFIDPFLPWNKRGKLT